MNALLILVLAALPPVEIRAEVEGGAEVVIAYRDGMERARAEVVGGRALLAGLAEAEYDLIAMGPGTMSAVARGVRDDARLVARRAFPVTVDAPRGTRLVWEGLLFEPGELRLPEGIHRLVAIHPDRVPSEGTLVRVRGPSRLGFELDPGLVVVGTVAAPDGRPIPGATVEAFADGRPTGRLAHSGADGSFGIGGFRGRVVSLRVRAIGWAETLRRIDFRPGEERTRCDIALVPGSSVSLTVRGGGGQASALLMPHWLERVLAEPRLRANVLAERREGGRRFRFSGLSPGAEYRILVSAPGCLPESVAAFAAPPAGACAHHEVTLHRGAAVAGQTAPGAVVACTGREGRRTVRADRRGRFHIDGLLGGEYLLTLVDLDETGERVAAAAGAVAECSIAPPPASALTSLRGTVADADGRPLPGVEVRCGGCEALSGADGAFVLEGLARGAGEFALVLSPAPGCRALHDDPHLPFVELRARPESRVVVRLERAGTLRIRLDTAGRPLARATLLLAAVGSALRREVSIPRGGDFVEVTDLPTGGYVAEVGAPGFLGTLGAMVLAHATPQEPQILRVVRGRSLAGRVFLREGRLGPLGPPVFTDTPLDRATVRLVDGDPKSALAATSVDPDGYFRLVGLPAAPLLVCASAPGLPATLFPFDLTRADIEECELPLQRAVEATLRVTDPAGNPILGVEARVLSESGLDVRGLAAACRFHGYFADVAEFDDFLRTFADWGGAGGRLVVPFLAPGSYRLRVRAPGYEPAEVGVRAWTPWQVAQIRALPLEGVPADLEPYLRLRPLP